MNTPMNTLNTQIYEEASEWMILHRSDELDAEAKRRFDAWLRESPQHLRAYLEMSTIWEDVPALRPEWNPSANELIARARAEANVFPLGVETVPQTVPDLPYCQLESVSTQALTPEPELEPVERAVVTVPASMSKRIQLLAAAAMFIVVVGITCLWYLQHGVYTTDTGEQRTLALTDGSTVELNAQTKIRIAYTDNQRTIQLLRGQALFKVAKDPNRPFVVDSDGTRVRAVGTQFDVYKKDTGTQITVVEGRVAVAPSMVPGSGVSGISGLSRGGSAASANGEEQGGDESRDSDSRTAPADRDKPAASSHALQAQLGEVLLSAGEQILIADTTPTPKLDLPSASDPIVVQDTKVSGTQESRAVSGTAVPAGTVVPANVEAATAWTQQRLVFDFSPLSEVAAEFNRYNRRPMKVECHTGDSLCSFNISGSFSSTDPTLLLRFLREQPGIVVTETTDEIRISREDIHG